MFCIYVYFTYEEGKYIYKIKNNSEFSVHCDGPISAHAMKMRAFQ